MAQRQSIDPAAASGFDAHHPPSGELIDHACIADFACPLPHLCSVERGDGFAPRPHLPDEDGAEGDATINETWVGHFDACLGCMACMTACPSGVDYGKLIEATRAQIERRYSDHPRKSVFAAFFSAPSRARTGCVRCAAAAVYQTTGLASAVADASAS